MAANNPTRESYREDWSPAENKRVTIKTLSPHTSFRITKTANQVSMQPAPAVSHEHYEIPDEDIPEYSAEEQAFFDNFKREKSGFVDFGGVYEEDDVEYGENYDIPAFDGPAYTDDEIVKFDLFQKAHSANVQFDGVYDSDEEFEGSGGGGAVKLYKYNHNEYEEEEDGVAEGEYGNEFATEYADSVYNSKSLQYSDDDAMRLSSAKATNGTTGSIKKESGKKAGAKKVVSFGDASGDGDSADSAAAKEEEKDNSAGGDEGVELDSSLSPNAISSAPVGYKVGAPVLLEPIAEGSTENSPVITPVAM